MSYLKALRKIELTLLGQPLDPQLEKFKEDFPGNYILDWHVDHQTMTVRLKPAFDDPKEELMWIIKYS